MIELTQFADKLMTAVHGSLFHVNGEPFIFEASETKCYLLKVRVGDDNNIEDFVPWQHVRSKATHVASLTRKEMVELLLSGKFIVS